VGWVHNGKFNFTYIYIGKTSLQIFFSRTAEPEKLKLTRKLSKFVKVMCLGVRWGPNKENLFYAYIHRTIFSRTIESEKVQIHMKASRRIYTCTCVDIQKESKSSQEPLSRFVWKITHIVQNQVCENWADCPTDRDQIHTYMKIFYM
jgi:hypothetical protein